MKFPQFIEGPLSATVLEVGDIVKVIEKASYSDSFSTHYVLIEGRGVASGTPFIEITDLHVGGYNPSLTRRVIGVEDSFWDGLKPAEYEEAIDAFQRAKASSSAEETSALRSYEEAHAKHVAYMGLADRIWG
jgi:hypothetical protein